MNFKDGIMSMLSEMANRYFYENDEVVGEEPDVEEVGEVEEEPEVEEVEEEVPGAQSIVDTLMAAAPDLEKTVHSMLKYAANTDDDENVFDEALRYYEENVLNAEDTEEVEGDEYEDTEEVEEVEEEL